MKPVLLICTLLLMRQASTAQTIAEPLPGHGISFTQPLPAKAAHKEIRLDDGRWRLTRNHLATGGFVLLAGMAKGFNETLQFHWKEFHRQFPGANPQWFNPSVSWTNKYKDGNPDAGPKHFLSTSVLIMFTDQYHLDNFINRMAWGSAVVFKLGEGKKRFKQYLLDFLYYGLCHQAGFALTYYPFSKYHGK